MQLLSWIAIVASFLLPVAHPSPAAARALDGLCHSGPLDPPDHASIPYKTFQSPSGGSTPILLDEYDPVRFPGQPMPAMVLVHGGGWWENCRWNVSGEAWTASHDPSRVLSQHFVVFSIDYRLSCNPADPELRGTPLRPLCGWTYPATDPSTGTPGAAIHDVQDAVAWVRTVWSKLPGHWPWNGKVALVGTSAGGDLALMAAALSSPGDPSRPDAVAAWSGSPELDRMSNGSYGCDPMQTDDPASCWRYTNQYLGCARNPGPDPSCVARGVYASASPITAWSRSGPPVFFANGGGPRAGVSPPELAALQEADDFARQLQDLGFPPEQYQECVVDSNDHGTQLLPLRCTEAQENVWQATDLFLVPFVT